MDESEVGIGPDGIRGDAGFFVEFSKGGLGDRFIWIDVSFGKVPSVGMFHQEELQISCFAPEDQVAARKYAWFLVVHSFQYTDAAVFVFVESR